MLVGSWVALIGLASAQTRPDQEYRDTEVTNDDRPLEWAAELESQYYEFDNLDFRPLDETSDQSILDTDDRGHFGFTGASIEIGYRIDPQVRFVFEAGHRGLWGNDQIGSINEFGGFLYVPSMFAEMSTAPENGVQFRVGRQYFQIGGLGGAPDYVLADVLDMVRVDIPIGEVANVTLIPLNVYATADDLAETNFVSLLGQQEEETFGFGGDTMTRRYGGVVTADGLPIPVDATLYAFYSDVGAQGTGSDISYDGLLGNVADNDWVLNAGLRANVEVAFLRPFAELALSSGIDRKELVATDVDCNGLAYQLGVVADARDRVEGGQLGFWGSATFFDAYGAAYGKNALQYSHGYVSMKGQQVGGTLMNRMMGWHPSAYLGRYGIADDPHDVERIAGTRVMHADFGIELPAGLVAWAGWWTALDNGVTFTPLAQLDNLTPPFGYSIAEFEAQRRLGSALGTELDLEVGWRFGEHVSVFANGAYLLPGGFYAIPIDRVAGDSLGTEDPAPAWATYAGTRVEF